MRALPKANRTHLGKQKRLADYYYVPEYDYKDNDRPVAKARKTSIMTTHEDGSGQKPCAVTKTVIDTKTTAGGLANMKTADKGERPFL